MKTVIKEENLIIEIDRPCVAGPVNTYMKITHEPTGESVDEWGFYRWKIKKSLLSKLNEKISRSKTS